jgi:hypothetical protein
MKHFHHFAIYKHAAEAFDGVIRSISFHLALNLQLVVSAFMGNGI